MFRYLVHPGVNARASNPAGKPPEDGCGDKASIIFSPLGALSRPELHQYLT